VRSGAVVNSDALSRKSLLFSHVPLKQSVSRD